MRILYVAPLNSIHSKRWIGFFAREGHTVCVVDTAQTGRAELEGATVHQIPLAPTTGTGWLGKTWRQVGDTLGLIRRIRQIVRQFSPDVLHIHWMADGYAYAAARSGFPRIMATPWGDDLLIGPSKSLKTRAVVRSVIRSARRFCCDAEHLRDALVRYGASIGDVDIVYFGTDTVQFSPQARDPGLAAELGFPSEAPIILSNRALLEIYNVATLVRAVPRVLQEHPEARFVVVGGGDQRQALESLAHDLGVGEKVRFAGRLSDADMVRYAASATIYVSTSLSDGGLAASTAEAMACGVPVVISDFGQNGAWVEHGEAGRLFALRDSAGLAREILRLLSDEALRRRLAEAGRKVIMERNNYYVEMRKVEGIYRSLSSGST